MPLPRHHLLHH